MPDDHVPATIRQSASAALAEPVTAGFGNSRSFEFAQRAARALAASTLVPESFRSTTIDKKSKQPVENPNAIPNCIIALNMAQRMGADPLMVMQNLYVVEGRPSWSAQFVIAAINSCGRFSPLRFDISEPGDEREISYETVKWVNGNRTTITAKCKVRERSCRAWAIEKATGERLDGPEVSIAMAEAEGWIGKNGSKWQTMPEVMLRYRSASFFGKLYAPELLMGLQTAEEAIEEVIDITPDEPSARPTRSGYSAPQADRPAITDVTDEIEQTEEPEPEPVNTFELVTEDGEARQFEQPGDWANAFYGAIKNASSLDAAKGLWETNSGQLQRLRAEHESGAKLADAIDKAYGAAFEKFNPRKQHQQVVGQVTGDVSMETHTHATGQPPEADSRPNAPRELGKIPTRENGGFDWFTAAKVLGDAIGTSASLEDVTAWQQLNMNWIEGIQKGASPEYSKLQKTIQATRDILGGVEV